MSRPMKQHRYQHRRPLLVIPFLIHFTLATTSTPNTGDQRQAFTFAYTASNLVLPILYTCPTPLSLTQLSPTNAGGPDPVAPYTLVLLVHEQLMDGAGQRYERIYSRSTNVGDMSNLTQINHPWMDGTQFIGCVWASNGVSGGCQDLTTIVPSSHLTAISYDNATSPCRVDSVMGSWVTNPSQQLDVTVESSSGTVSVNAWPSSCSDLRFTPKNGTGPYTLVIAPASHPPVNISSSNSPDNSMNYTVRLTHGQSFMAGVYDSAGNSWAIGPLHAGQSTDLGCLAVATGQEAAHKSGLDIGVGAFAGGIVGAFVVGALGVGLLLWVLGKKNRRGKNKSESQELLHDPYVEPRPASYRGNSGNSSTFNKLVTPYAEAGGYTDTTPVVGYDTPSTLYDPAPSGSSTFPSTPDPNRPFPHPPRTGSYSSPYDPQQPYRENVGLTDFSPSPHFRDGSVDRTTSDGRRESFHTSSSQHGVSGGGIGRGRMGALHAVEGPASPGQRSRRGTQTQEDEEDAERKLRNVYVVHSDGGGDVHIQLPQGGVNVIELPPNYRPESGQHYSPTPQSPPPGSIHSTHSHHRDSSTLPDQLIAPFFGLEPSRSRGSGFSDMSEQEIRARAEAALAEKGRAMSSPQPSPRPPP